ncbi:hypothetical protein DQ04_08571010 [Trypanosoma grayi]|uniref:hypothetical protein n=1 Tax=Trypanosoma grayi TaxID=71804 RepID=UPI0004F4982D|nr:hypothetical protein DQ04_08571010 [Trypanosoma grayi]KEG07880.1 hypothetical protein DQ04_08571010 [Trypanosoma grayi]
MGGGGRGGAVSASPLAPTAAATDANATEEWADDNGFFEEFAKEATLGGGASRRKRSRQAFEEVQQSALQAQAQAEEEDEVTRKARAEEARRQIAAKVLARASPREVQQAVRKAERESNKRGDRPEPPLARQKKRMKRGHR